MAMLGADSESYPFIVILLNIADSSRKKVLIQTRGEKGEIMKQTPMPFADQHHHK